MASHENYNVLLGKLDKFIRKYYKNQLIKGALYSVALVLGAYLTVTTLEYFGRFGTGTRAVLFYGFMGAAVGVLGKWIVVPFLKLNKLGKVISHEQAAEIVGQHFHSDVNDKLLNTLQLKQLSDNNNFRSDLLEASIGQKIEELKPVPFSSAIDFRQNTKYLKYALPPLAIFLFLFFGAPSVLKEPTDRLVRHQTFFEEEAPFKFKVTNNDLEVVEQDDFELEISIEGEEVPEVVFIQFEDSQYKMKKKERLGFKHLFKNVQSSTKFRFFADGFSSAEYELKALPKPIVLNFSIDLDYPSYVGKTDETVNNTGDLVVPAGTKVNWKFNTRNTEMILFGFTDTTFFIDPSAEDQYAFSQNVFNSQNYSVTAQNEFIKGRDSLSYTINVVPDQYPEISVDERADSLSTKRIYFKGSIKDDYGFSNLTFNYQFTNSERDSVLNGGRKSQTIGVNGKATQDQFFHFWDLADLDIKAGEEIEYYFEIWDNDGVSGAKSTRSGRKVFKAPSLDQIAEQTEKNNESIKENLEESIVEARELQRDLQKLERKLIEKKELSWEDKKQLSELLEKQKSLQQQVENLEMENLQNQNQQNEYKEADERILEKQKQLQELFNQVMTEEMKELFEEMEKLMEEMNKEDLQEKLEEMDVTNKDIEKELDRTLEIFKQMEFEQKLQESIDKLDELKEKQEELSEKSEEKDTDAEELEKEQEELEKEFEELQKELEDLEKKNEELEQPNDMPDTESLEEQIKQEMKESSESLQKNQKKKASKSQKGASQKMGQMQQQMQQTMDGMQSEAQQEDLDALRQILENLVQLSFDQEDLMADLKGLSRKDPKYVAINQQQKKLKDDAKMIEDSLFALSKRVPQIEATINREISAINLNMDKSIDLLANRDNTKSRNRQQLVMTSVNNLALLLDEIVQQMQQSMAEQKFGSGSCNKPGGMGAKPSAANMKSMQKKLNEQIQKMKNGMSKDGKKPGQQGGKGGKMSKELAQMAAQQEAIRNELRKLAEEYEKEGNGAGKGDLDKLSKMMEETETDLVNKNITRETLRRQQEIMSRLLEHEKAERERELDNKRESKEAKNEKFSNPTEFFEYNRMKEKEVELLKTVPPSLNTFYKNKVNEYFNNFE